jgi:putative exosortase-associated protein (TIGR04073 family)
MSPRKSPFTSTGLRLSFPQATELMRKPVSLLGLVLLAGVLVSGCAGPEKKLGRGISNLLELVRWGDAQRTIEQTSVFESPNVGMTTGVVKGINKSLARAGIGLYEIVTFPIPTYDPIAKNYLTPNPVSPDSYKPGIVEDSVFSTDAQMGFSGGEIAPLVPGSRFKVFNN